MDHVDITPSPRVLRMLGQIDFAPWQCLAELIDNSIDAFIDQVAAGNPPINPKVSISLPSEAQLREGAGAVEVSDNGSGMTIDDMRNAVRAGYSGNDPVEKMGLFGMGFNISTARLGRCTEIWTATRESPDWIGIVIDFDDLERKAAFEAPIMTRPKSEIELANDDHGTRVRITRLEADRIRALTRGAGKRKTMHRLGKIYGRVMDRLQIILSYDGDRVTPKKHCVWDRKRAVDTPRFGRVPAVLEINETLPSKRFCTTCWVWLADTDEHCNACGHSDNVINRERSLKGWLGVQRYFDKEHFGIDLIRNGRVIEELDKSFFHFVDDAGERILEYPIDAIHWGGRIVGELEIDFVRVSHQKDSFDKLDPEWRKVVELVRGVSPMQPRIAERLSLAENISPLAKLFAGYRKGTAGLKDLVPGTSDGRGLNSGPVQDYLDRFNNGEAAYQGDDKWYELVLQAERGKKGGGSSGADKAAGEFPIDNDEEENLGLDDPAAGEQAPPPVASETKKPDPKAPVQDARLSRVYTLDTLPGQPSITVEAFEHFTDVTGRPYTVRPDGYTFRFDYNGHSPYFEESLDRPVDCLLTDLANHFLALASQSPRDKPVSSVARELRGKYFPELSSTIDDVGQAAGSIVESLKRHFVDVLPEAAPIDRATISEAQLSHIYRAAQQLESATRAEVDARISNGTFAPYVTDKFVLTLCRNWPSLVANGRFFVTPLEADEDPLTAPSVLELLETIADVLWLHEGGVSAINKDLPWRLRYARSVASLRLLESWRS